MKKIMMFTATWCGPCQATKPAFNALKELAKGQALECVLVDVDANGNLAQQYNVRAVPTFVLLDNDGIETARKSGGMSLEALKAFVNQ